MNDRRHEEDLRGLGLTYGAAYLGDTTQELLNGGTMEKRRRQTQED